MSKKKIKRPQQYKKPKDRTLKEWWGDQTEASKKKMLYICIAVAAVIALILIWYYAIYDDGSLKVKDNAIVGAQENWLIGERSSGKNSHYYHLADVATPEGYESHGTSNTGSSLRTDFTFTKTTENGDISLYVAPVSTGMDSMVANIYAQFAAMVGENGTISDTMEYKDCKYFVYTMEYDGENGAKTYHQSLVLYAPAAYSDACVLVSASVNPETAEGYWTNENLLAETVKALDSTAILKK